MRPACKRRARPGIRVSGRWGQLSAQPADDRFVADPAGIPYTAAGYLWTSQPSRCYKTARRQDPGLRRQGQARRRLPAPARPYRGAPGGGPACQGAAIPGRARRGPRLPRRGHTGRGPAGHGAGEHVR